LVVTWGGVNYAWGSWEIIFLIFVGTALFALFIAQELRHPEPIINLRLFRIRNFAVICVLSVFFGISMFAGFSFLPIYFQNVRGNSAIISGLKLVPMVGGMMITSIATGVYIAKTGEFIWFPKIGMAIMCIGLGLLALMNETMSFGIEWIFIFIVGAGMGVSFPVLNGVVQNSVPPQDMASSVGATTFIRSIGGSVGIAIYGSVLTQQTSKNFARNGNLVESTMEALQLVFLSSMYPGLVAFLMCFAIEKTDVFSRKTAVAAPPVLE